VTAVYRDHGMFQSDSERLLSQLYVNRQTPNAYFSIAAVDVQGLRQIAVGETEDNRAFPLVAPLVEARYDLPFDVLGGRLRLMGSGVMLSRFQEENFADATGPTDNSRRATGEVNWMRTFILPDGLRLDPFLDLRADLYNVNNLSASNTADHTLGRSQETAGLNLTWPFVRATKDETIVLEPIVQFLASPNVKANPNIPDEDSLVFTYDETNLFDPDKFSGYDIFDGGERLNLGGRATIDWLDGHEASVLIGRTLRAQTHQHLSGRRRPQPDRVRLGGRRRHGAGRRIVPVQPGVAQRFLRRRPGRGRHGLRLRARPRLCALRARQHHPDPADQRHRNTAARCSC